MSLPPLRDDPAETNTTKLRKIAEKLVENAMDGDIQAIKEVADRLDSPAPRQRKRQSCRSTSANAAVPATLARTSRTGTPRHSPSGRCSDDQPDKALRRGRLPQLIA